MVVKIQNAIEVFMYIYHSFVLWNYLLVWSSSTLTYVLLTRNAWASITFCLMKNSPFISITVVSHVLSLSLSLHHSFSWVEVRSVSKYFIKSKHLYCIHIGINSQVFYSSEIIYVKIYASHKMFRVKRLIYAKFVYAHNIALVNFFFFYLNIKVTAVEISHEFNTNPPHSFHIVRLIRI